ncbi:MAG: hypothetical protein D9V44_10385 [Actinobacteria bacterium]|nr:MAG: hypothetical protein D9V44_10385 [Actinomycetota bacterium]
MRFRHKVATIAVALVMLAQPTAALAVGTGDDPTPTRNVATAFDVQVEREYQAWLLKQRSYGIALEAEPTLVDAPYKYFFTPTHLQETNYYCGPATVQTIDDYWGTPASQQEIAKYLGTDVTHSTDFSLVDNAINKFAGENYTYVTCTSTSDVYSRIQYGLLTRGHPAATDVRIDAALWPNYEFNHDGHIVPIEAFDWRYNKVRINDPYDEAKYRGGGNTSGHKTYSKSVIAAGIMAHPRRAIVY